MGGEAAMNPSEIEILGTLQADGTLVLDEKPNLPPGRMRVVLYPIISLPTDDPFWQAMQAIWDAQKRAGVVPRTREEIDAQLREMDEESEEEMREIERLHEGCQRERERKIQGQDSLS
jgi:hypothetical protein